MLNSTSIVVASILIYNWPTLWWLDPSCTFVFAVIVVSTTVGMIKDIYASLMQGTGSEIDTDKL